MLKRLPGRTQRPRGFKVKHVLQISLLLGICFWLVYQVKHSHDKKKELDESGSKNLIRSEIEREKVSEVLKLGRKDIPREDVREAEKPDEDDEEEVALTEEEKHENDNKHEDEQEEIESNREENEEIDESDLERKDEDFVDEEKELDGGTDEETRQHIENSSNDHDLDQDHDQDIDGGDQTDHEAREEHYKADDASSEVAHEARDTLNKEIKLGTNDVRNLERGDDKETERGSFTEKVEDSSVGSAEKQLLESTQSDDQPEVVNDPISVTTNSTDSAVAEDNNPTILVSTEAINSSTETGNVTLDHFRKNGTEESVSGLDRNARNLTIGDTTVEQSVLQEQTNSSDINLDYDKVDPNSKESSEASTNTLKPGETAQAEEESSSSGTKENGELTEDEKSNADGTVQHDPIDSSDTQTGQEATEARADLRSRGDDNEEAAAE